MENEEIMDTEEDTKYRSFRLDGFKIRTNALALAGFRMKMRKKVVDAEEKMRAWVQGKMRLQDPKKPVKEGEFDKAAKRLLDYIFKDEIKEARKQTKLTDGQAEAEQVAEINQKAKPKQKVSRCKSCHRPESAHGKNSRHKFVSG